MVLWCRTPALHQVPFRNTISESDTVTGHQKEGFALLNHSFSRRRMKWMFHLHNNLSAKAQAKCVICWRITIMTVGLLLFQLLLLLVTVLTKMLAIRLTPPAYAEVLPTATLLDQIKYPQHQAIPVSSPAFNKWPRKRFTLRGSSCTPEPASEPFLWYTYMFLSNRLVYNRVKVFAS